MSIRTKIDAHDYDHDARYNYHCVESSKNSEPNNK